MSVYVRIDEIASAIGLSASTVKKYYLLIEEQGYRFKRNNQGQLIFSEQDFEMFKRIVHLKNEPGMSVQKAVEQVVTSITAMTVYKEKEDSVITGMSALMKELNDIKEFMEKQNRYIDHQEEINKELMKELKSTKMYVKESLEERDKTLKLSLKETQEVKQMMAAAKDTKKWWRFFLK